MIRAMATQVLLADDDVELSVMLKEYLEREGYSVTAVHDGEAAALIHTVRGVGYHLAKE